MSSHLSGVLSIFPFCPHVRISVHMSICPSVHLFSDLSIFSVHSVHMSVCLSSKQMSVHMYVHQSSLFSVLYSVYLSIRLSAYIYFNFHIIITACPSVCPSNRCLYTCMSIKAVYLVTYLFFHSVHLSIFPSFHLSILSICPFVHLSVHMSICAVNRCLAICLVSYLFFHSVHRPFCPYVSLSVICMSIKAVFLESYILSTCPSVYLSIYILIFILSSLPVVGFMYLASPIMFPLMFINSKKLYYINIWQYMWSTPNCDPLLANS